MKRSRKSEGIGLAGGVGRWIELLCGLTYLLPLPHGSMSKPTCERENELMDRNSKIARRDFFLQVAWLGRKKKIGRRCLARLPPS